MLRKELVEGLTEGLTKEPVKVLFELDSRDKATLEIVGRSISVKAAVMTILSELADHYKIPLVTLIEEFLVVAQSAQHLGI
jgi:hypothetical protein